MWKPYNVPTLRFWFLDKLGWPVELIGGRPILNFLRLLIHTRKITTKWRMPWDWTSANVNYSYRYDPPYVPIIPTSPLQDRDLSQKWFFDTPRFSVGFSGMNIGLDQNDDLIN